MSPSSRQIVNEVNNTTHLDEALSLVVKRSRSSMGADACSVYIYDPQTDRFILMAVDGVMPDEVGKALVSRNEGLVGWVAAHEEVISLSNAADHPGFDHISKTGDESFHGFLGAPIIHHGRTMGVLVAQKLERRSFSDDDTAFLTTLAFQLGGVLHHLLAKWDFSRRLDEPARGLADKALKIDNEADSHRLLNRALKAAGLNALVRENCPSKKRKRPQTQPSTRCSVLELQP